MQTFGLEATFILLDSQNVIGFSFNDFPGNFIFLLRFIWLPLVL